jgi:hypothetical protein
VREECQHELQNAGRGLYICYGLFYCSSKSPRLFALFHKSSSLYSNVEFMHERTNSVRQYRLAYDVGTGFLNCFRQIQM